VALQGRLNRKARLAISAATLVVLAGPFLGITTCISTALRHQAAVAPFHPLEDGLLRLDNGATLFLTDGALSRKISAWLNSDTDAKWIFEIADSNFIAGSTNPTPDGWNHISQLAQILVAGPQLHAQIGFPEDQSARAPESLLARSRIARLRDELVSRNVPASQLTFVPASALSQSEVHAIDRLGSEPHLVVILSR